MLCPAEVYDRLKLAERFSTRKLNYNLSHYLAIFSDMFGLSLAVYLIGKSSISAVVTSLYMYTAELYPTQCRHNLFAFSSMVGRIGSITAPLTPAIVSITFYL